MPDSPADLLREAAALLRDSTVARFGWVEWTADPDALCVAMMGPRVALALADWLESRARTYEEMPASTASWFAEVCDQRRPDPALATARAVLGRNDG